MNSTQRPNTTPGDPRPLIIYLDLVERDGTTPAL
jgi:hypothetical protein